MENCAAVGQATDDNIIRRMRIACWINKATDTHTHTHTHTHTRNVQYLLHFHGDDGYGKALQYYVAGTLPEVLTLKSLIFVDPHCVFAVHSFIAMNDH